MIVVLTLIVLGALVLAIMAVVAYFNSGAAKQKELRIAAEGLANAERYRAELALTALREIAAGAELPVFVASDTLAQVNATYRKEIQHD